jgi:hypothetical protein
MIDAAVVAPAEGRAMIANRRGASASRGHHVAAGDGRAMASA